MKKELLFSFVGHLVTFVILIGLTKAHRQKQKSYPDVFQVSVVNFESGFQNSKLPSAISLIEKKPVKSKPKPTKVNEKILPRKPSGKENSNIGLKLSCTRGKYSYYIDAVLTKIGSNWINPLAGSGIKFSTTIFFVIEKTGRIANVKIEKSSGNELFDRACERAVIITQTLPPLMGEFANQDSLRLHLEFEFTP